MALSKQGRQAFELIVKTRRGDLKHAWAWPEPLVDKVHGNIQELITARLVRRATPKEIIKGGTMLQDGDPKYVWALTKFGIAVAALLSLEEQDVKA